MTTIVKLILAGIATLVSMGASAQTDTLKIKNERYQTDRDGDRIIPEIDIATTDGVLMKDGKVMCIEHGKMTFLGKEITMSNGTRIKKNGSFWKKNGSKSFMKMGDHIDLSGKLVSPTHPTVN